MGSAGVPPDQSRAREEAISTTAPRAPCFQPRPTAPLRVIPTPAKNLSDTPAHSTRQRRSPDKLILDLNPGAPGVSETCGRRERRR